jgi:hypothetical protein
MSAGYPKPARLANENAFMLSSGILKGRRIEYASAVGPVSPPPCGGVSQVLAQAIARDAGMTGR